MKTLSPLTNSEGFFRLEKGDSMRCHSCMDGVTRAKGSGRVKASISLVEVVGTVDIPRGDE